MPDCSVISSIYIILKSSFRPFDKAVSDILARLGYKILEKKELIFNQDQAAKFIDIIETSPRGNEVIELRKEWNGRINRTNQTNLKKISCIMLQKLQERKKWSHY